MAYRKNAYLDHDDEFYSSSKTYEMQHWDNRRSTPRNKMAAPGDTGMIAGEIPTEFSKYRTPLVTRYASPEMAFNFSEMKKFSTWRRLWTFLAKAEKVLNTILTFYG